MSKTTTTAGESIFIGNVPASFSTQRAEGSQVFIEGELYNKISNVEAMRPFFMSVVSDSNHWLFISSTGGLSAGRKDSEHALFPYYTDDKITEATEITGSKSIFLVSIGQKTYLWEPFSIRQHGVYKTSRNLYKNALGNKIIFEEINHDLGLNFSYAWNLSDQFGFVRRAHLKNLHDENIFVRLLDGIQNVMPFGVDTALQNNSSNLVDAYKKCELEKKSGLALFSLSAIIVDRAEPSEALRTNLAWSYGLEGAKKLISSMQLDDFRQGHELVEETDIRAEKGAYFLNTSLEISPHEEKKWTIVAEVNKSVSEVIALQEAILNDKALTKKVESDIKKGDDHLIALVGATDGLQLSEDKLRNIRHFSNSLFNIMRGGIFDLNYQIQKEDFCHYLYKANHQSFKRHSNQLNSLPNQLSLQDIKNLGEQVQDKNFSRLAHEYLPLMFSRRHGDPSRPWNKFSINTKSEIDGSKILDYEGNWRDIFQNWEALSRAYPGFLEGMLHKFLNATTFDGYNAYRITKDGFDWETIEPDNPWSYIGYWGDHQIIYLLKFLELIEAHYPNKLANYFSDDCFVYAQVPYKIKPYEALLRDPKNTIDYDYESESQIEKRRSKIGADGALLNNQKNQLQQVNFIEKILSTLLAKLSNFIPEAGIWMNTQRPEWNDANNALVGHGVSMVTLYYLRRFLAFFSEILQTSKTQNIEISEELYVFFKQAHQAFLQHEKMLDKGFSNKDRKQLLDLLGGAGSAYRKQIYDLGFSGEKKSIALTEVLAFSNLTRNYMEQSIRANKRDDNLYHAYNLMTVETEDSISIRHLPEMLEGQVAVLSSGYLNVEENLKVLDALKASALFRPDQYSYILYPNKQLPRFLNKNTIPKQNVEASELLKQLIEEGNQKIFIKDCLGEVHFNGNFNNAKKLEEALDHLPKTYAKNLAEERNFILDTYETVFNHKAFTGRSGTFFGYEGLGSIYWHMVSKLLLATYEITQKAIDENADPIIIGKLFDHYFEINAGIGCYKSPALYGAFPTDPYSHTPGNKGAQQPGMTGQVKEDILSRFGELGVIVKGGLIQFSPSMLRKEEFLTAPQSFQYVDVMGHKKSIQIPEKALVFTYCQVPIVYKLADREEIACHFKDASVQIISGNKLDAQCSQNLFHRTGEIEKIVVAVTKN